MEKENTSDFVGAALLLVLLKAPREINPPVQDLRWLRVDQVFEIILVKVGISHGMAFIWGGAEIAITKIGMIPFLRISFGSFGTLI